MTPTESTTTQPDTGPVQPPIPGTPALPLVWTRKRSLGGVAHRAAASVHDGTIRFTAHQVGYRNWAVRGWDDGPVCIFYATGSTLREVKAAAAEHVKQAQS